MATFKNQEILYGPVNLCFRHCETEFFASNIGIWSDTNSDFFCSQVELPQRAAKKSDQICSFQFQWIIFPLELAMFVGGYAWGCPTPRVMNGSTNYIWDLNLHFFGDIKCI